MVTCGCVGTATVRRYNVCEKCGKELVVGMWPFCPHPIGSSMVIGDDIPGGVEIKHGVCWPDGTPRRFYSKSEIRRVAYETGWTQGTDTPKPNPKIVEERAQAYEARQRKQRDSS